MGKIADLFIKLGLKKDEFDKGLNDAKKQTDLFGSGIKKLGGMIAGAFAVSSVVAFGKELMMLGGQVEGVRAAFNRIADEKTLDDLKAATRGTVSELELMKKAVMASNFGIPVQNLSKLLEFATKRAQETGQSVDYLVESIVLGIGRKSPLILDNLGISAVRLRKEFRGVGIEAAEVGDIAEVIGKIIDEEMKKSGGIIETNAIKVGQLAAAWMDFKTTVAESGIVTDIFGGALDMIIEKFRIIAVDGVSGWKKLLALFSQIPGMDIVLEAEAMAAKGQEQINKELEEENKKREIQTRLLTEQAKKLAEQQRAEQAKAAAAERAAAAAKKQREEIEKMNATANASRAHLGAGSYGLMTGITSAGNLTTTDTKSLSGLNENGLSALAQKNSDIANAMKADWDNFASSLSTTVNENIIGSIETFSESLGQLVAGEINLKGFFSNILSQLSTFLGQMGKLLIAFGVGQLAFGNALKNIFNPEMAIPLIAAGAAMVALSGAIGGLARKAASSGNASATSGTSAGVNYNNLGYSQNQTIVGKVSGRDLALVLERNRTYKTRT